jgi:peptide/nickel transport system substrate-binding protein
MQNDFNARKVDGMGGIDPNGAKDIEIGHNLLALALPRYYAVFFNQNTVPALKDKAVRQTLSDAIDRKRIVREVFGEYAAAVYGPIPPSAPGYDESALPAPRSGEKIAESLDAEKWLVDPDDGIRYKTLPGSKGGRMPLRFDVLVPDIPVLVQSMRIVAENWKTIGAKADIAVLGTDEIAGTAIRTRNYQALLFGNVLKRDPDIFAFWHSSRRFHPGLNLSLYGNKTVDALLEIVRRGEGDAARRDAALGEIQRTIFEDAPAAFLFSPTYLYAVPKGLGGFSETPLASPGDRFDGVEKWHLETKRVWKRKGVAPEGGA